ncbi:MAG: hypothetical protein ACRDN0_10815 [Trebonia sp.]
MRWLHSGVAALWVGVAMLAAAIATGVTHGPGFLVAVFVVLMVVCGIVGFCVALVGGRKSREEDRRLVAQARERAEAQTRHDRRPR